MSIQKIIQEAINKNPLSLKEALEEELRVRVGLALEAKMKEQEEDEDEDEDEDDLDESASKFGVDTGPLMKANAWIKPAKLGVMLKDDELGKTALAVGHVKKGFEGKTQGVAVLIHNTKDFSNYFKKGLNKPHSFYYDTGNGYRQTNEQLVFTGVVERSADGEIKVVQGKADMNAKTTLMVFK